MCEVAAGRLPHPLVYEDATAFAFLNAYPVARGYVLVAPREHREAAPADFSEEEYAALQRVVWRVGEAVRRVVPTERLYVLSLGSNQGNAHVHWHVVPLPPGVPPTEQQLAFLDWGERGERVLAVTDEEQRELAGRIAAALPGAE